MRELQSEKPPFVVNLDASVHELTTLRMLLDVLREQEVYSVSTLSLRYCTLKDEGVGLALSGSHHNTTRRSHQVYRHRGPTPHPTTSHVKRVCAYGWPRSAAARMRLCACAPPACVVAGLWPDGYA